GEVAQHEHVLGHEAAWAEGERLPHQAAERARRDVGHQAAERARNRHPVEPPQDPRRIGHVDRRRQQRACRSTPGWGRHLTADGCRARRRSSARRTGRRHVLVPWAQLRVRRAPYTSIWPPISTTWFGGIAKNSVGERALRARKRKSARRQPGSSERPVDTKVSRPRKQLVRPPNVSSPCAAAQRMTSGTLSVSMKP